MSDPQVQVIAEDAVAISVNTAARAQTLAAQLRRSGNWIEVVPGMDSVTIRFNPATTDLEAVSEQLTTTLSTARAAPASTPTTLDIPVYYGGADGPDLADICTHLSLTEAAFIKRHSGCAYPVEMIGFTPGFAYLGGLDKALSVPRRAKPRAYVPAGSIGISGNYSGLYAMPGPGGWPLIGRTEHTLFDARSDNPFLIQPGQLIRFVLA